MPAAPSPLAAIDTSSLYRMPWTMADNGFSWLEPTRRCNLSCEYCYQRNDPTSVKNLAEIAHELDTLVGLRRCDVMIIAGGDPLTHPDLGEVVRLVRARGLKPVVLTNGHGLDARRVSELKASGAFGFFFHVDRLIVMQPHDVLPNGEQDECDGCPNKTYWGGRLVSECRKEDYLLYGRPVMAAPRGQEPRAEECPRD
jgi:hypothetical protein